MRYLRWDVGPLSSDGPADGRWAEGEKGANQALWASLQEANRRAAAAAADAAEERRAAEAAAGGLDYERQVLPGLIWSAHVLFWILYPFLKFYYLLR